MSLSIKRQIMDRIVANLGTLAAAGVVREVRRELDPLASQGKLPLLLVYDGEEGQIEQDNFGRTYQFPVAVKILIETKRNLGEAKDEVVAEAQRVIESDVKLGGLAYEVNDGSEQPYINELGSPVGGALLFWTVTYRRKLGDPYTTY